MHLLEMPQLVVAGMPGLIFLQRQKYTHTLLNKALGQRAQ
jgi:hypothetical protein